MNLFILYKKKLDKIIYIVMNIFFENKFFNSFEIFFYIFFL
jgi:hypothetical protein